MARAILIEYMLFSTSCSALRLAETTALHAERPAAREIIAAP
jgi:hypothetical protein